MCHLTILSLHFDDVKWRCEHLTKRSTRNKHFRMQISLLIFTAYEVYSTFFAVNLRFPFSRILKESSDTFCMCLNRTEHFSLSLSLSILWLRNIRHVLQLFQIVYIRFGAGLSNNRSNFDKKFNYSNVLEKLTMRCDFLKKKNGRQSVDFPGNMWILKSN